MMSSWQRVSLADACSKIQDGAHKSPKEIYPEPADGRFPYLTSKNIRTGFMKLDNVQYCSSDFHNEIYPRCNPEFGDVLLTKDGASTGNVCINTMDEPFSLLSSVCLLKPNRSKLLSRFLAYYIQSKEGFEQITGQMTGAAIKRIILKTIKASLIPLPSIPEQKRIVAILDDAFERIDAAIANTEKNLANARELLERTIESVFGEPHEQRWDEAIVEDLALKKKGSIRTGPFGSQLLHSEFVESGIAVLGIDNAVNNEFRWGKSRFITEEKYEQLERYTVKPGDVIITIMGTCGRCAIIPDDIPTAINTKHLCCISLDKSKCSPEFLHAYFLHHPLARDYLIRKAKGAIMAGLNMGIIKKLPVMLPSLGSQEEIVIKIETLKQLHADLEVDYQQKLAALSELKQSILQKAFAGELTADMNQEALVN